MKTINVTSTLKEGLFSMFLEREIERQMRLGEKPDMKSAVISTQESVDNVVEIMREINSNHREPKLL